MCSVSGWRVTGAAAPSTGMLSSNEVFITSSVSNRNRVEEEEEVDGSEENDMAPPLPSVSKQLSKPGVSKGTSAKDKRRLREKRRSTGVATLSGHQADELTTRNTSYNEMPGIVDENEEEEEEAKLKNQSVVQSTPVAICDQIIDRSTSAIGRQRENPTDHCFSTPDHKNRDNDDRPVDHEENSAERLKLPVDSEKSQSYKSTTPESKAIAVKCSDSSANPLSPDFSTNLCPRPFEAKKGILKTPPSRPIVSPKPGFTAAQPTALGTKTNEEIRLMSRISELEALLESEKKEKALLEKFLSVRDSRIRELESQIVILNEDLDLADEDYIRMEEENRALARALSQLNAQ